MDVEDVRPKKTTGLALLQEDLSRHSIADLDERIETLKAEIERCQATKLAKQSTLAAAQGFFKK